jgi:hypothetical protein
MPKSKLDDSLTVYVFFVAFLLINILITILLYIFTYFEKTITINDKISYSSGKYMNNTIIDENGIVYSITNSLPLLYFTSAEVFLKLEKGKTYRVTGYGLRIPILGMFPNLLSIKNKI